MRPDISTKRSLIFLHGFPFSARAWDAQVAYVEKHFAGAITPVAMKLRGHRPRLPTEPAPWLLEHYVADLEKYLDQSHIEKAVLCGLSMGGYIALRFAVRNPHRVAGLILADTRADADSNEAKEKRYALIERLHREGLTDFAKEFSKQVLSRTTLEEHPEIQKAVESMILSHEAEDLALVAGALASRPDSTSDLAAIDCPTLVIVGRDDTITPVSLSEKMARAIPGAKLRIIDHAGHLSNIEQGPAFNDAIAEFLRHELLSGVFEDHGVEVVKKESRHSPHQNQRD